MNAPLVQALQLMRDRRYAEAMPLLFQICGTAPAAIEPWTMLALCLLARGDVAELLGIVELRHRQAGDGLKLFNDCLCSALSWPDRAPLQKIIAGTPDNSVLSVISRYVSGLVIALDGAVDQGIAEIKVAAGLVDALPAALAEEGYVQTILTEAALLASFAEVAAFAACAPSDLLTAVGVVQAHADIVDAPPATNGEPFVFFSSCDERYLDRFGETVVRALDATGTRTIYHLHVVDPTPALAAKIARLQALCSSLTVRYSTEVYRRGDAGYTRAEYYACARLVRLPEIFALYDRDVFIWDVDTNGVSNLAALTAAMRDADIGYFQMKNTRLTLVSHLASVYVANTPAGRRCADMIRNYVLAKLPDASLWLLDQAAVYCVTQFLTAEPSGFRLQDFSANPGGAFADYVDVASSAGEKQDMRKQAGSAIAA